MNPLTALRAAFAVCVLATIVFAGDKTPPSYLHGTIEGYETRMDTRTNYSKNGGNSVTRHTKVYELKGPDLAYQIDDCGSFQAGKFSAGQAVDYRVEGERLYIRRDDGKEYKCKVEGTRSLNNAKPAESPKPEAPAAAPPPGKP